MKHHLAEFFRMMEKRMKRIRVYETGEPEVMVLEETPDPQVGDRQVLVEVRAI